MHKENNPQVNEGLLSLARGPFDGVQRFTGYVVNGFRFHTKELEGKRSKQNSGILVKGMMGNKKIDYYGVLKEIIELQYFKGKRIVLFKCDWWDVDHIGKGVKKDKHGFVSVNPSRKLVTDEPFVLASQVEQVFYVRDGFNVDWLIALKGHSENFYDFPVNDIANTNNLGIGEEAVQQADSLFDEDHQIMFEEDDDAMNWQRTDIDDFSAEVTADDDIVEEIDSDPETEDEDLLL